MTVSRVADPVETFSERDYTRKDAKLIESWRQRMNRLGHLYRYVSLQDERLGWFEDVILRSKLFFSGFSGFNDPFDGRLQLLFGATEGEVRALWEAHLTERGVPPDERARARVEQLVAGRDDPAVHREAQSAHDEEQASIGVLCLSESPDDLPMWGYYADSHRGACLRFHALSLIGWDGAFPPMRVTYSDKYPKVYFYRDSRFRRCQATLATKAKVWRHEREWRMLRQGIGAMTFPSGALDGVIMGSGIAPEVEVRVRTVVADRKPPVKLMKAHIAERKFKLDIRPS